MEVVKTAARDKVEDKDVVFALVVDCCQNMEMPVFGLDQPSGETSCCAPEPVNLLGIVDCNP
jgi:hypothetical protein